MIIELLYYLGIDKSGFNPSKDPQQRQFVELLRATSHQLSAPLLLEVFKRWVDVALRDMVWWWAWQYWVDSCICWSYRSLPT